MCLLPQEWMLMYGYPFCVEKWPQISTHVMVENLRRGTINSALDGGKKYLVTVANKASRYNSTPFKRDTKKMVI